MNLFTKKKKKGFTIVELVIVIAVIGVLAAILIPTFVGLVNKANVAADGTLVRELNNAIAIDSATNGKHETMHDALLVTDEYGFNVQRINAKANQNEILWDSKNDVFCYFDSKTNDITYIPETKLTTPKEQVKPYEYFVIRDVTAEKGLDTTYSTYLRSCTLTSLTPTKGLDVGDENVTAVTYNGGTDAQNVVIRTNSYDTALTVNAPLDTIHHYGSLMSANLQKVSSSSYYEHGDTNLVEIASGRLVITNDANAKVDNVYLTATDGENYKVEEVGIIIATQSGAKLPDVIRRDAVTETEGKVVCTIQTNVDANGEHPQKVDVVTIKGTDNVQEATNGYTNVADLTKMVLEAPTNSEVEGASEFIGNDVAVATEEKQGVINEAKGTVIEVTFKGAVSLHTISEFRDLWNAGEFFDLENPASIKLTGNVDMKKVGNWGPIGTWEYPFFGTFDGQKSENENYKISNLSNHANATVEGNESDPKYNYYHVYSNGKSVGYGETYGFFGIVGGGDVTVKNIKFEAVDIDIVNGKNVGAVIGYAPKVNSSFNEDTIFKTGAITFDKVEVSGSVSANAHGAGLIGKVYSTGKLTMNNCINSADISSGNNCGGLVGYIAGPTEIEITGCTNNGNVHNTATSNIQVGYFAVVNTHNATDKITLTNNTNNGHCINGNAFHSNYNNPSFLTMSSSGSVVQNSAGLYDFSGNVDNGYLYQNDNVNYKAYVIVPKNGTASLDVEGNYENNSIKVNGTVNISKGIFGDIGHDHGTLNISGGTFAEISAAYNCNVLITGGTIGQVKMTSTGANTPEVRILTSLAHGLTVVRGGGGNNLYTKVEGDYIIIKTADNTNTSFDSTGWTKLNGSNLTWTSFTLE